MFTGIIRHTGEITSVQKEKSGKRFFVSAPDEILSQAEEGITSIAVNGACHTVEKLEKGRFSTFSSFETLKKTTMGTLKTGVRVNLELPLTLSTLLDGHLVQGHVDGIGKVVSIEKKGNAFHYRFSAPSEIFEYFVEKDSVSIDGISLTLFDLKKGAFSVAVIPETASKTTLGQKKPGADVNLEVNLFAKYARDFAISKEARASRLSKIENYFK